MLTRLRTLNNENVLKLEEEKNKLLSNIITKYEAEWKKIVAFISYEYSSTHLSIQSDVFQHCCTHALNEGSDKFDNIISLKSC